MEDVLGLFGRYDPSKLQANKVAFVVHKAFECQQSGMLVPPSRRICFVKPWAWQKLHRSILCSSVSTCEQEASGVLQAPWARKSRPPSHCAKHLPLEAFELSDLVD